VNFVVRCSDCKPVVATGYALAVIRLIVLQWSLQITNIVFLTDIMITIDQIAHNRRTKTQDYLAKFLHSLSQVIGSC